MKKEQAGYTEKIMGVKGHNMEVTCIFWVSFIRENGYSDSLERFYRTKTKGDFFNWIENKREEVEKATKTKCVVSNCGMI
jgi:hypothetical protein